MREHKLIIIITTVVWRKTLKLLVSLPNCSTVKKVKCYLDQVKFFNFKLTLNFYTSTVAKLNLAKY